MRHFLIKVFLLLMASTAFAQDSLPSLYLAPGSTIHFLSPEPIRYVDISTKQVAGDLALPNLLRVRLKDSATLDRCVVTIVGEDFLAQYQLFRGPLADTNELIVNISPDCSKPLDISGVELTQNQLRTIAYRMIAGKQKDCRLKVKKFGIEGRLNNVYAFKDYLFLDLSFHNRSKLRYDIDALHFAIKDKKVTNASNVQSVELKPIFVLDDRTGFSRTYRNVFVFKKMSFPGSKVLQIELNEQQLSGRVLDMTVPYSDILGADNLPD